MGMFQSNAGGAWDNAKKSFEKGVEIDGKMYYKKSEPHMASVTGDTVGDPFKDTSGPSMNILIKLMSIVSLVIAPHIAGVEGISAMTQNSGGAAIENCICPEEHDCSEGCTKECGDRCQGSCEHEDESGCGHEESAGCGHEDAAACDSTDCGKSCGGECQGECGKCDADKGGKHECDKKDCGKSCKGDCGGECGHCQKEKKDSTSTLKK